MECGSLGVNHVRPSTALQLFRQFGSTVAEIGLEVREKADELKTPRRDLASPPMLDSSPGNHPRQRDGDSHANRCPDQRRRGQTIQIGENT
jgi:hypothetical protein